MRVHWIHEHRLTLMKIGWIRGPQLEMNLLKSGFVVHISNQIRIHDLWLNTNPRIRETNLRMHDSLIRFPLPQLFSKDAGIVYESFRIETNQVIWKFWSYKTNPRYQSFEHRGTKQIHEKNLLNTVDKTNQRKESFELHTDSQIRISRFCMNFSCHSMSMY